jgi:DNA repair protein SbcD/Mre11
VRFVHTSDWHLGKRLFEASLLEEQAHALDQIFAICREERADALIIAGDLYDRAVPPVEAVALLSDFAARVVRDLGIPIIAISGNHDSPDRLGFASELLARGQVHLRTSLERRADPVVVERGRRRMDVYCLPYVEPEQARSRLSDPAITDHAGAVAASLAAMADARATRGGDAVLVAHLFASGGRESPDSERPLVVGGSGAVAAPLLRAGRFGYVALGHLHEAQAVGEHGDVRYSGAPCKYSFGEAAQVKSVNVVDFVCGRAAVRTVPLTPRRELVRLEGSFDELLRAEEPRLQAAEAAYVQAIYTDGGYVLDAAARLRARYPHLLQVLPRVVVAPPSPGASGGAARRPATDPRGLLAAFWATVEGEDASPETLDLLERALASARDRTAQGETCALAS